MPIITPAYPSMCSTFNVTHSNKVVIQKELDHFAEVVQQIMMGKLPWKSLFVKHTFFTKDYKYYIAVIAASTTKENSKIWGGFVESKIRLLVQGLERHSSIRLARPFNKGYERRHRTLSGMNEWQDILDGSLKYVVKDEEVADEKAKTEPGNDAVKPEPTSPTKINQEEGNSNADIKAVDVNDMDVTDGEVKPEGEDADGPKDIYTSTHYIGIELHDGKCQPSHMTRSPLYVVDPMWSFSPPIKRGFVLTPGRLTIQARNNSIYLIKSMNSRISCSPGTNMRRSCTTFVPSAFSMCESTFKDGWNAGVAAAC